MRFLVDENLSGFYASELRKQGWDVKWMTEVAPSADDDVVIGIALSEDRIILTSDIHLASRTLWEPQSNVPTILLRLASVEYRAAARLVVVKLLERIDWHTIHAVITPDKVRIRPKLRLFDK
jgi:predicted nuclease of predicted toxin-antitoxin system